ncbi:hypothetical protein RIF29_24749 [Crotalaria pallida]|uniref:Uncharacterized protein n=1 Tax=Crotalaria pallida TaxID=3830 RepID=A0AAN9I0G6_CROPI
MIGGGVVGGGLAATFAGGGRVVGVLGFGVQWGLGFLNRDKGYDLRESTSSPPTTIACTMAVVLCAPPSFAFAFVQEREEQQRKQPLVLVLHHQPGMGLCHFTCG